MPHNDKTQSHRAEQDRPNRESNMEKAEGSREAVTTNGAGTHGGRGSSTTNEGNELTEEAVGQPDEQGAGISNRPIEEEQGRQEQLPPRGERRESRKEE